MPELTPMMMDSVPDSPLVSGGRGTISVNDHVAWPGDDGVTEQTGVVIGLVEPAEGGDGRWQVNVLPDVGGDPMPMDPRSVRKMRKSEIPAAPASAPEGSTEAPVVSDNMTVQDSATSEAAMPDNSTPPAEGDPAAAAPGYLIVEESQDCMDQSGGTLTVAVVGGDGAVESCHPDTVSAQARVDELMTAVTPVTVEAPVGMSDDDLIAELARRFAGDIVDKMKGTDAFGGEVEVEINLEGESEGEGYPEDAAECEMCAGSGEVSVNGVTMTCPECMGNGWVESEVEEPVMPMMDGLYMAEDEPVAAADDGGRVPTTATYDWEGVLIVEGVASGDGRQIAQDALSWRELPIPLMLQTVNAPGHEGAVIAGSIHEIVRDGQNIIGRGFFDSGDAGAEARRLLTEGTMRGVSADIDSVIVEFMAPGGESVTMEDVLFSGVEALEVLVEGRIMGATLTPFPAFQEAHVRVLAPEQVAEDVVLVASGAEMNGDVWRVPSPLGVWLPGEEDAGEALAALVASAGQAVDVPANPPRAWFEPGKMDSPEPFTVHADGRVYGLVARWGSCHIGFTDRCVNVPKTGSAYKHFRNKNVLTAEGELVATGPIFMDTVHPDLRLRASDTQAFYADTGCAVADVALYENEFGIVAAGALRPGLTPEQVRRFRGSDVSPDWRQIKGRLEVVGLLSVNVSGFIVEGLVASGATVPNPRGVWDSVDGELTSLVAAGMVRQELTEAEAFRDEFEALKAEVAVLSEAVRPIRAQRAAERFALLAQAFGDKQPEDHGCGGACGGTDGVCACES